MNRKRIAAAGKFHSLFGTARGFGAVVASEEGLLEVFLPFGGETKEAVAERIADNYPLSVGESPLTKKAADLLARYFAEEEVAFPLAIDRNVFTPFQWAVYEAVMVIPYGEVKSYSQVAAEIGSPRGARGIGGAMARNPLPIIIPCHRVVGKSGEMTGYSGPGGVASKQWLLAMEKRSRMRKM